jgi:hypothetical protein
MSASSNPSILMSFWAPVEYSTPLGDELRGLGGAFVGRHVIPRYRGYMQSQGSRLLGVHGWFPQVAWEPSQNTRAQPPTASGQYAG